LLGVKNMSDPLQSVTNLGNSAASFGSSFVTGLYYAIFVVLILAILGLFAWRISFKAKVRLRYLTDSFDKIKDTKGKLIDDRSDGVKKLKVLIKGFKTINLPAPPTEAISLTNKGKDCFEIEIPSDGNPRYIIKEKNTRSYKSFDSNDRVFYLNEHEKMVARKSKSIHDVITAALPYLFILILFIGLIAFWGDIVEPFNQAGETNLAIMKENAEITKHLKEIIKQEQVLDGEIEILSSIRNSSRPPD
jgi:hypothetical protein